MRLEKKLKQCLTSIMLISFLASQALANPAPVGRYIQLSPGQSIPWPGWCFDNQATGQIFGALKTAKESCDLLVAKALAKQKAESDLEIGKLLFRVETLQKEHDGILLIKQEEIDSLEAAALKRPNDYNLWWAIGGVVVGALTTISVGLLVQSNLAN